MYRNVFAMMEKGERVEMGKLRGIREGRCQCI
jgi:hypothetical protein